MRPESGVQRINEPVRRPMDPAEPTHSSSSPALATHPPPTSPVGCQRRRTRPRPSGQRGARSLHQGRTLTRRGQPPLPLIFASPPSAHQDCPPLRRHSHVGRRSRVTPVAAGFGLAFGNERTGLLNEELRHPSPAAPFGPSGAGDGGRRRLARGFGPLCRTRGMLWAMLLLLRAEGNGGAPGCGAAASPPSTAALQRWAPSASSRARILVHTSALSP